MLPYLPTYMQRSPERVRRHLIDCIGEMTVFPSSRHDNRRRARCFHSFARCAFLSQGGTSTTSMSTTGSTSSPSSQRLTAIGSDSGVVNVYDADALEVGAGRHFVFAYDTCVVVYFHTPSRPTRGRVLRARPQGMHACFVFNMACYTSSIICLLSAKKLSFGISSFFGRRHDRVNDMLLMLKQILSFPLGPIGEETT